MEEIIKKQIKKDCCFNKNIQIYHFHVNHQMLLIFFYLYKNKIK